MRVPKNPFHPGEILLEEFLVPGGITQAAMAQNLGGHGRASMSSFEGNAG